MKFNRIVLAVVAVTLSLGAFALARTDFTLGFSDFASVKACAGGTAVVRIAVNDLPILRDTEGVTYIKAPAKVKRHTKKARKRNVGVR